MSGRNKDITNLFNANIPTTKCSYKMQNNSDEQLLYYLSFSFFCMILLTIVFLLIYQNKDYIDKALEIIYHNRELINNQIIFSLIYYIGIVIGVLVLMEFICLQFNFAHLPSTFISKISDKLKELFEYLGKIVALISSFYARLKLELLWQAISNLFVATAKLLISPFYFLEGYKDIMLQYKYPIMVIVGTATIIGAVSYGIYYYM